MIMDDLKGKLEPDYPRPKVPDHLEEVDTEKNNDIKLNFSDYWNILKAIFRNEALNQLQGKPSLIEKALALRYIGMFLIGIVVLFMIVSLFK